MSAIPKFPHLSDDLLTDKNMDDRKCMAEHVTMDKVTTLANVKSVVEKSYILRITLTSCTNRSTNPIISMITPFQIQKADTEHLQKIQAAVFLNSEGEMYLV